ncbi:unnamed protein product [Gongylonema pulchrum]|uniref:Integrase catalytic domain-containing protein n=1 Tax=Gongylonema pulchrum TaxID=637853 RepID=A0A183DPK1_9BILA|nr:unnamed protein product [Gongylonema pulchrum]
MPSAKCGQSYLLACLLVHLELVSDLSTNNFLNTFRRFISRRGIPKIVYSDQATTFQYASKVLTEGGFYERIIGMAKNCFRRCICRRILVLKSFAVLFYEVEAVLNSRPLVVMAVISSTFQITSYN